jgi:hypothetical protein
VDIFDFCPQSRVIRELAPEESGSVSMNGWDFSSKPNQPYRRTFVVKLHGMRWYTNDAGAYDPTVDAQHNAALLLQFYHDHRLYKPFILQHEHYGRIECKFKVKVDLDPAIGNSGGLMEAFDVTMIHNNPRY